MDNEIRVETAGTVRVITPRIRAEIEPFGDNIAEFEELVLPLVDAVGARVVIDLESSAPCDGFVSVAVRLHTRARSRGARIVFARPDVPMRTELNVCKLDQFLEIHPSLESAILALEEQGFPLDPLPKSSS